MLSSRNSKINHINPREKSVENRPKNRLISAPRADDGNGGSEGDSCLDDLWVHKEKNRAIMGIDKSEGTELFPAAQTKSAGEPAHPPLSKNFGETGRRSGWIS